jgi:Flp pilus assembly protein TadG
MLRNAVARFARSEGGTVMAEAVLVLPFMLWAYLGLFVYWDAYRTINKVQKATYTISDMISREMITIPTTYVAGMDALLEQMIDPNKDASIRVTSVTWSKSNNRFEVHWSRVSGSGYTALTTSTLQNYKDSIPEMSDGDYVVIVESTVHYTPAFDVGIGEEDIKNFIVTRPRFVPKICMSGVTCT